MANCKFATQQEVEALRKRIEYLEKILTIVCKSQAEFIRNKL